MAALQEIGRKSRQLAAGYAWRAGWVIGTPIPAHYEPELVDTIKRVRRHTMTTSPRIAALCDSVRYIVERRLQGALVECGVWRGGSMMAVALTLLRLGQTDRDLYLFDTFGGMPQPSGQDTDSPYDGYDLHERWRRKRRQGSDNSWNYVTIESVRARIESTGYPPERIHLVKGLVEETIPDRAPDQLALLRLDTDWYASTRHEMRHLYPRLTDSGVLILDDYGHYEGARRAVDEYLAEQRDPLLLQRIDYTGRLALKPPSEVRSPA